MRISYKFFLFFYFLFLSTSLFALNAAKIDGKSASMDLTSHCEFFIDAQNHFGYEEVSKDSFLTNFQPLAQEGLTSAYTDNVVWIRCALTNEQENLFQGTLEIPLPWMDGVEAYTLSGGQKSILQPKLQARSFFIPITIVPKETTVITLKTKGKNSILLAPLLHTQESAKERLNYTTLFNGFLIGVVLMMIFYNLINAFTLRKRYYVYYALYLAGLLALMGTYYGYNTELFAQSHESAPFWIALSLFAALLFMGHFLEVKEHFASLHKYLLTLLGATLLFGIFSLFAAKGLFVVYSFVALASAVFLFLLLLSFAAYKRSVSGALLLLLAWILLGAGELIAFAMSIGLLQYDSFVYDAFALMVMLNILMLSSSLSMRIQEEEQEFASQVTKEHDLAERLNLSKKALRELNEKSERKIARLEAELLQKNQAFEKVTLKDEVIGLYGKGRVEEILTNELHRTKRYDYYFGIILINIDGLQEINTKHGHEVGNSLMKEMADIFTNHLRYLDTVGRWSETEYIVVCPQTNAQNTLVAAEHLQKMIQTSKFFFVGSATASFGVSASKKDDTLDDLLKRGYQALALAKTNGKNRAEAV